MGFLHHEKKLRYLIKLVFKKSIKYKDKSKLDFAGTFPGANFSNQHMSVNKNEDYCESLSIPALFTMQSHL